VNKGIVSSIQTVANMSLQISTSRPLDSQETIASQITSSQNTLWVNQSILVTNFQTTFSIPEISDEPIAALNLSPQFKSRNFSICVYTACENNVVYFTIF
jgi:hypothetical protein